MAGQYFSTTRCTELSVIEYLETQLNASWSNPTIPVVKSFLKAYEYSVPIISVYLINTDTFRRELGGNSIRQQYTFSVDIFAKSDGQRIDLADFVVNAIRQGCVYYNYSHSSGDASTLDKVADGRLTLLRFDSDGKVDFPSDAAEHDKFRHNITFTIG